MSVFRKYPPTFWVANTMEIFERMAWYGFFAVSSLYITGAPETGGLGLSSEQRGIMQGVIPFLLYLFPPQPLPLQPANNDICVITHHSLSSRLRRMSSSMVPARP